MERDDLRREISRSQGRLNGRYCYDEMGRLVQQQTGLAHQQNAVQIDRTFTYIYSEPGSYEPLAQCYKDGDNAEHTINYFHCDQIGIPREMTDSDGKLIWKGRYDAWGSLIRDSYRETASDSHQPFRLQNQYFDEETGLHYNFFRYYEPVLGRFITQDPIKLAGGNNLYRFEGTVQNQTDPLGLFAPALLLAPELIALGKAALITLGVLAVGAAVEETVKNRARASTQAKTESTSKCKKCPPCITTSGRIVPPKTIGYRPLDVIPDDKMEHGVYGSHHNIFESNQAPYPNCKCFWSKQKYVLKPYQLTPAMVPVEPFVN